MIQKIRMDMSIGSNIQKRRYQCKLKQDQVIAKMNLMGIPPRAVMPRLKPIV